MSVIADREQIVQNFVNRPLVYFLNYGQMDQEVRFAGIDPQGVRLFIRLMGKDISISIEKRDQVI